MHYLNFFYQIPLAMYGNSLIWPMVNYHLNRKLSNKIALRSVIGSGGLNSHLPITSSGLSPLTRCGYLWLPGALLRLPVDRRALVIPLLVETGLSFFPLSFF